MRPGLRLNNDERRSCLTLLIEYELPLSAVTIDAKEIISCLLNLKRFAIFILKLCHCVMVFRGLLVFFSRDYRVEIINTPARC